VIPNPTSQRSGETEAVCLVPRSTHPAVKRKNPNPNSLKLPPARKTASNEKNTKEPWEMIRSLKDGRIFTDVKKKKAAVQGLRLSENLKESLTEH
jgi:hypothetical protein